MPGGQIGIRILICLAVLLPVGLLAGVSPTEGVDPNEVVAYLKKKIAYQLYHQPDSTCTMQFRQWQRERPMRLLKIVRNDTRSVFFLKGEERVSQTRVRPAGTPSELVLPPGREFSFGTPDRYLRRIFLSESAVHWFTGMVADSGQRQARFHFVVPRSVSNFEFRCGDEMTNVELQGEYRVDSLSVNLDRLVVHFSGFPAEENVKSASEAFEFGRPGDGSLHPLQPVRSELRFIQSDGFAVRSESRYTGCSAIDGVEQKRVVPNVPLALKKDPPAMEESPATAETHRLESLIDTMRTLDSSSVVQLLHLVRPAYPSKTHTSERRSWIDVSVDPLPVGRRR